MIKKEICERVLTIGPSWINPKGGIAQVLNTYAKTLYQPFNFVVTTKGGNFPKVLLQFLIAICVFFAKILHKNCKIVHIHSASYKSFYRKQVFIYIAKALGKKVVLHIHGAELKNFADIHHKRVRRTLAKCDTIIVLSQSWKDWFEQEFKHPNIIVIKNVIDVPVKKQKTLIDTNHRFSLLFLGILGQRKGIYDLLEVINKYKCEFEGKLLLIIGGNGEVESVIDYIRKNSLENIVHYKGWVSGTEKIKLFNSVDSLILPSYNEGLPISIIEAMSYGLPIISTPVGGIPEIVSNGENGLLVKPGNQEELYQAIRLLMDDARLLENMGRVSKQKAKGHLPENVGKELCLMYEQLLNN